jgi:hypothetical protein
VLARCNFIGGRGYAYKSTAEYHEEYLDRQDPAHSRTVMIAERPRNVILLKDTHTVYKSKCAEQSTPTAKDDKPSLGSSIRKIGWSHSCWRTSCWRLLLWLFLFIIVTTL